MRTLLNNQALFIWNNVEILEQDRFSIDISLK